MRDLESLVESAIATREAALLRFASFQPIHPLEDFHRKSYVFSKWRREFSNDERSLCRLRTDEARCLFAEFCVQFNKQELPLAYYGENPQGSDLKDVRVEGITPCVSVALATHTSDWSQM